MSTPPDAAPAPSVLRGRVVTPQAVIDDGVVVVDADRIVHVGPSSRVAGTPWADLVRATPPPADGVHVLPGLVDLHDHGGGGASFPDAADAAEAMVAVAEHRRHGTTSLVASLVTAAPDVLRRQVSTLAALAEAGEIAGIHAEGPFLSTVRCGAQDPAYIVDPDLDLVDALADLGRGHLVTMTFAPEAPGATGPGGLVERLVARGVVPSIGHTDAAADVTRVALEESWALLGEEGGRSRRPTVTHLFNGMRELHHRAPGPIPPLLRAAAEGRCVVELIADGTHVDPSLVADVVALVGAENVALVTDAMAAAGMADGTYRLGPADVVVDHGVARLAAGGSIAGGTAHLLDVVRTTVAGGVSLVAAVHAAATTPAAVLGDPSIGALEAGRRADVLVTDSGLRPRRVLRAGVAV
nr:amidohydrolase family protein [Beutenbergia cavernae]